MCLWKTVDFSDNAPKYMFSQLCSRKYVSIVKSFQIRLLIHGVVGLLFSGLVSNWSVVGWLV